MVENFERRRIVVKRECERILIENGGVLSSRSLIYRLGKRTRYSLVPSSLGNLLRSHPRIRRVSRWDTTYYELKSNGNPDEPSKES